MSAERPPLAALAPPQEWMSWEESSKAWMSVRDADLLELLLVAHCERLGRPANVLEWGAGRSTPYYSGVLEERGLLDSWLSIEHNREFFTAEIASEFEQRASASWVLCENAADDEPRHRSGAARGPSVRAVLFDSGDLRPYEEERDRDADLDDYVALPSSLGLSFDAVIVDGRKRRRCLLEARDLLGEHGIVILHDAWRTYYQCAWGAYPFGRRIGDMLWVGAGHDPGLGSILPAHAFENHADGD